MHTYVLLACVSRKSNDEYINFLFGLTWNHTISQHWSTALSFRKLTHARRKYAWCVPYGILATLTWEGFSIQYIFNCLQRANCSFMKFKPRNIPLAVFQSCCFVHGISKYLWCLILPIVVSSLSSSSRPELRQKYFIEFPRSLDGQGHFWLLDGKIAS